MLVRFKQNYRVGGTGYRPGQTADLPEDQARAVIDKDAAEEGAGLKRYRITTEGQNAQGKTVRNETVETLTEEAAGEVDGEVEEVMSLRFRHPHTVDGQAYLPGSIATVAVSEEAWQAVNEGHADLDPPPGVAGQPFPPEELRRDESTDVPLPQIQPQMQAVAAQPAVLNPARPAGMAPAGQTGQQAAPAPATSARGVPPGRDNPNPANQPPADKRAAMEEAAKSQSRKDAK